MRGQIQKRRGIEVDLDTYNDPSSSRPISLDLHTYNYQKDFVRHHMREPNYQQNNKYNKENCEYDSIELLNRQKTLAPSRNFYYQNDKKNKIYSSLRRNEGGMFDAKPIDLDAISTSSGSGDDDDCFDGKSPNMIAAKHIFYSTSDMTTSDSEICRYPNIKNSKRFFLLKILLIRKFLFLNKFVLKKK